MSIDKKKEAIKSDSPEVHFWIKREDGIYSVDEAVLGSFSMYQAISVAIATHKELKRQLLIDAIKGDKKVKGIKVVDALVSSLNKIDDLFPNVMKQIDMYTNNMTH